MALAVANQYAQALADVLAEGGAGLDGAGAVVQLRAFESVLEASRELRNVLLSPAVGAADKESVVERLAETLGLAPVIRNFLLITVHRRRIGMLGEIREALEEVLDARAGIVRAQVRSWEKLEADLRQRLETSLAAATGSQVRCRYEIDKSLLGGAVVRIGSTVYDGSVRGRLEALRERLAK